MIKKRWNEYAPEIAGKVDANYRSIESCESVCFCYGGFQMTGFISPADARLMAAAPELLESLEELVKWIECDEELENRKFDCAEVARAAIKKARGEE